MKRLGLSPRTFVGATSIVTGAASGIGEAIALELAREGASRLALVDRDGDGLERVMRAIASTRPGVDLHLYVCDLGDHDQVRTLAEVLRRDHPRLDLLVNNAGVAMTGRFDEMTLEDFCWVTDINLRAPIVLTHGLLDSLKAAPGSHIVNVSSIFGLIAPAGHTAYCTSKFGLRGFGEALRIELSRDHVGLTTVHPGGVKTRISEQSRLATRASQEAHDIDHQLAEQVLVMPPAEAARIILAAARKRRARVLVGNDARLAELVPRLFPERMGELLDRGNPATGARGWGRFRRRTA